MISIGIHGIVQEPTGYIYMTNINFLTTTKWKNTDYLRRQCEVKTKQTMKLPQTKAENRRSNTKGEKQVINTKFGVITGKIRISRGNSIGIRGESNLHAYDNNNNQQSQISK